MNTVKMIVRLLVIVGAINWGLWGFFQFDLVAALFGGSSSMMARVVYSAVGLSGLVALKWFLKCGCSCHSKGGKGCSK